jgi:integrase
MTNRPAGDVTHVSRPGHRRTSCTTVDFQDQVQITLVSLLSDSGMPLEQIARLLGHNGTAVTERVYRHQLRPVLEEGAAAMDGIFRERPPR